MPRFVVLASLALAALACEASQECAEPAVTETCTPAYEPTYANVFAKTLSPTCAKGGSTCHAAGGQGGLSFLDADVAYEALVDRRAVVANGVACSTIVTRIEATEGSVRMPPGRSLPEGETCAIRRWIAAGAPR